MITRYTIKRLERELEGLEPVKTPTAICEEIDGLFYYGEKAYKTTKELIEKEGIKAKLIILD